jgi:hypothetical protein
MSKTALIAKAVSGEELTEAERATLSPSALAQLAAGGYLRLTSRDMRRLSKPTLAQLALGGFIELNRYDRDGLDPVVLTLLTLAGRAELTPLERLRLPKALRACVDSPAPSRRPDTRRTRLSVYLGAS